MTSSNFTNGQKIGKCCLISTNVYLYNIHMDNKNKKCLYELGGQKLKIVEWDWDLGIIVHSNGKTLEQCTMAANKANQILGMIKKNIKWKDETIIIKLYKASVRPKLELCIQAWCPQLKKDQEVLEKYNEEPL